MTLHVTEFLKRDATFSNFGWDENLKDLKCKSIDTSVLWKANGCPTSGDIYNLKRCVKSNYKRALRQKDKDEFLSFSIDLNDYLLQKDQTSFWKTWKAIFTSKAEFSDFIDGSNNASVIAETFACMFEGACGNNSSESNKRLFRHFTTSQDDYFCNYFNVHIS